MAERAHYWFVPDALISRPNAVCCQIKEFSGDYGIDNCLASDKLFIRISV